MMSNKTVYVWDIAVRVFHWSLVVFFAISYVTGEEDSLVHVYTGYAVMGLVLFRVIWGFVGSRHARFSDFLYARRQVGDYLKSLMTPAPQRYVGHTPPGGWMIMSLLVSLLITSLSGLKVYGLEGYGPLASHQQAVEIISTTHADPNDLGGQGRHKNSNNGKHEADEEWWEEIHEFFANLTLFLVFIHVVGVVVSSRLHRENLIKAMVTGNKDAPSTRA